MTENTHGGMRQGSGRKRKSENGRVVMQISLTEDERSKIKEMAKLANKDVSGFIKDLIFKK